MLILRDMQSSDIEDYVRWFTSQTAWIQTDSPWEPLTTTVEKERQAWTEYFASVQNLPSNQLRWKFEIEVDGVHIGWVSAYRDTEWFPNPNGYYCVGIDIAKDDYRGKGYGTAALKQFVDYYRQNGQTKLYTQTWSGNLAMIAVAQKLGFVEVRRKVEYRSVNGKKYDALTLEINL